MMRCVSHQRPSILARLMTLALMTALSASSLLAAVAGFGCDRSCACCVIAADDSTTRWSPARDRGCCGPLQASPCRMAAGGNSAASTALAGPPHHPSVFYGHPVLAATVAGNVPVHRAGPPMRCSTGREPPADPLYLQNSRLIC